MSIIAEGVILARSGMLDGVDDDGQVRVATREEYPTWDFYFERKFKDFVRDDSPFKCFWPRGVDANIPALIEFVDRLEVSPVSGNQEFDTREREYLKTGILCETVCLVLSGALETIEAEQNGE